MNKYRILNIRIVLSFLFLLFAHSASSASVDSSVVKTRARDFFISKLHQAKDGTRYVSVTDLNLKYVSKDTCRNRVFGYSVSGGGYVIAMISGNDVLITGYSLTGSLDGIINPEMMSFFQAYESSQLSRISQGGIKGSAGYKSPLLQIEGINWNQGQYYNGACPIDPGTGSRTLVGCVGVAMGQILRYHKYPVTGTGSHSYIHPSYGTISADFGASAYNWNEMPGTISAANAEVAKLLFHVGVSVNMIFGVSASAAHTEAVPDALNSFFGYRDATLIWKDNFDVWSNEMEDVFRHELDENRPFYYELMGNPPHAVVVDGYDEDMFHINFGWGGLDNGFFILSGTNFAGGYMFGFRGKSILGISPHRNPVNTQDSLALVSLFNSTNGPLWYNKANWLTGPLRSWYGVDVVDGRVLHLNLGDNNLTGQLPAEIGKLTGLTSLNISGNKISGLIPKEIGQLSSVRSLVLAFNQLSGSVPSEAGNLANLRSLHLAFNKLSGTIPGALGNLASLKFLSLAGNELTGTIPVELCNLSQLVSLDLSVNQLTGSVPSSIGLLTQLADLQLSKNKLSGELPASISELVKLNLLGIDNNEFSGMIPPGIGSITNLILLNLDNNKFSGLPDEISNLVNVERFTAVNNRLSGKLSSGIGNMAKLKYLDLSGNQLSEIPAEIGNLLKLESLILSSNRLTSLPSSLGKLKKLTELKLSVNQISELPYEISGMDALSTLTLDYNNLSNLSFGISLLRKIALVDLSYNRLTGSLPPLSHINFYNIDLDHNKLTFDNLASSGLVNPNPENCYYWPQGIVPLSTKEMYFSENDSVALDIRNLTGMKHEHNNYTWYKGNLLVGEGPVLSLKNLKPIQGKYHCLIENEKYPTLVLSTDTIELILSENIAAKSDTILSRSGTVLNIAAKPVKIVKPSGLRGEVTWQASLDTIHWIDLPLIAPDPRISGNLRTVHADSLVVVPERPVLYRYMIKEEECDPVYSDSVLISPINSDLLLDTVINVVSSVAVISVDDIKLTIPRGLSARDFRLTIEKIETGPLFPDSVTPGPVFDVKLSCGNKFEIPIVVSIKTGSMVPEKKDLFNAVYFDESDYRWITYPECSFSYSDSSIVFTTNHLTKLSYWEKSWIDGEFTDKFVTDSVTVYYKSKSLDIMGLYAKKQTARSWHLPIGDPEYGTPVMIQDMAHFTKNVMARFGKLGLQVPESITVYADQIDDYGEVGLPGMINGYMTISVYIDDPQMLMSVIAHEYMHYTQDYYIVAQPGNIFWMEANGHTADRMVWDTLKLPLSESERYLLDKRTGEFSMFSFLSRSWDYWDASIMTKNLLGNVNYCYLAGTFIHYLRSYREGTRLLPEKLLKETSYLGSWRTYLDNYIKTNLNSTINDEYEDFVKFIVSGRERSFSLLNRYPADDSDPFKFFNQAAEEFAQKHLIKLPEDEMTIPVQKEKISKTLEPLSAKMEQFYNLSLNRSLCIKYVRQHIDTTGMKVYLCRYNPVKKTMDMTNISRVDSSYFFVMAASEQNVTEKSNQVFILYINKSGTSGIKAEYDLTITPVTDFSYLYTFWIEDPSNHNDAVIHKYSDGIDRRIIFWVQDGATRNKVYTDSSFTITETRSQGIMELYYNFRNGNMTITETRSGTYGYGMAPDNHTAAFNGTRTIKLKNVFFAPQDEQQVQQGAGIYDLHTLNTSQTQSMIVSYSESYHSECTDCGSSVVIESYNYVSTDWSGSPGYKLHIQVQ